MVALLAVGTGSGVLGADGEVFKYTDREGRTVYTDRPAVGTAERVVVKPASKPSAQEQARAEAQSKALRQIVEERLKKERDLAATEAAARDERDKRCVAARRENARFGFDGRQYETDVSGNRVYYTAQQIDERRAAAARAMRQWCPPQAR